MTTLSARHEKLGAASCRLPRYSNKLALCLALIGLDTIGHAQEIRYLKQPVAAREISAAAPCSPSWQTRMAAPIKITDSLIVSVPVKYIRYELTTCGALSNGIPRDGPIGSTSVSFDFFLPDFSGFTTERLREPFDSNEVRVAYVASAKSIERDPNHPADQPAEELRNMLHLLADPNVYRSLYGLRCYSGRLIKTTMYCYSANTGKDHKGILLLVTIPPYDPGVVNPLIRTDYFSRRYGGIEVAWWSSARNLARWRDIDAQVWKFLTAWNVARTN